MDIWNHFYKIPVDVEMADIFTDSEKKIISYFFTQTTFNKQTLSVKSQRTLSFILNIDYSTLNKTMNKLVEKGYLNKNYNLFSLNKSNIEDAILALKKCKLEKELIVASKNKNIHIPIQALRNINFLYKNAENEFLSTLESLKHSINNHETIDKKQLKDNCFSLKFDWKNQPLTNEEKSKILFLIDYLIDLTNQNLGYNQHSNNIEIKENENRDNNKGSGIQDDFDYKKFGLDDYDL